MCDASPSLSKAEGETPFMCLNKEARKHSVPRGCPVELTFAAHHSPLSLYNSSSQRYLQMDQTFVGVSFRSSSKVHTQLTIAVPAVLRLTKLKRS